MSNKAIDKAHQHEFYNMKFPFQPAHNPHISKGASMRANFIIMALAQARQQLGWRLTLKPNVCGPDGEHQLHVENLPIPDSQLTVNPEFIEHFALAWQALLWPGYCVNVDFTIGYEVIPQGTSQEVGAYVAAFDGCTAVTNYGNQFPVVDTSEPAAYLVHARQICRELDEDMHAKPSFEFIGDLFLPVSSVDFSELTTPLDLPPHSDDARIHYTVKPKFFFSV